MLLSKRETFSMVLAESLCCGTPVVGFKAGGPESIALDEFCSFAEYGDIDTLESELKKMLDKEHNASEISDSAMNAYDKKVMTEGYIRVYKSLVGECED